MVECGVADLSWQARIKQGVVQYNGASPPSRLQARRQLSGLDGGDLSANLAQGHASIAVDGGDLTDPGWSWPASPLEADGGVFD